MNHIDLPDAFSPGNVVGINSSDAQVPDVSFSTLAVSHAKPSALWFKLSLSALCLLMVVQDLLALTAVDQTALFGRFLPLFARPQSAWLRSAIELALVSVVLGLLWDERSHGLRRWLLPNFGRKITVQSRTTAWRLGLSLFWPVSPGTVIRPIYRHIVYGMLSELTLEQIDKIQSIVDILIKQRDDNVMRMYKTMFFLVTLLIAIFLLELNVVELEKKAVSVGGVSLSIANQNLFIFIALLAGNLAALLYSTIFIKMFMLEAFLEGYSTLSTSLQERHLRRFSYGFTAFLFGFASDASAATLPRWTRRTYRTLHILNIYGLPLFYIAFYLICLVKALIALNFVGTYYGIALIFFNVYTLGVYAFSFLPCLIRPAPGNQQVDEVRLRAYALSEAAGFPDGQADHIWFTAERQLRLAGRIP